MTIRALGFAYPEVQDFYDLFITHGRKKEIFWFDVTVNDGNRAVWARKVVR